MTGGRPLRVFNQSFRSADTIKMRWHPEGHGLCGPKDLNLTKHICVMLPSADDHHARPKRVQGPSSDFPSLPGKSILSPLESINLRIAFQAHTTTPKGWPLLFSDSSQLRGQCAHLRSRLLQ